jgi:hypothetical protein
MVGVGAIAILMIVLGTSNNFGFSPESGKGFIFIGISLLLFIAAGVSFSLHWIVGLPRGVTGVVVFTISLNHFSSSTNSSSTTLLPTINNILLL